MNTNEVDQGGRTDPELDLLEAMQDAREAGDWALYFELLPGLPLEPSSLLALRNTLGADWIREHRMDTSLADARWGPGWLLE